MNKHFIIYLILISILLYFFYIINQYQKALSDINYENQLLDQNLNSNIKIVTSLQTIDDSLRNRVRLLESNIITERDTILIEKTTIDSILYTLDGDSGASFNFYDKIYYPRFELSIDMFLSLSKYDIKDNKFNYEYIAYPDTISVTTFLNNKDKLLYSKALVNGKEYQSENNMYEKMYKGIYAEFIDSNINNIKFEWYDRIGLSVGIGYNWKGDKLPYLGLGYNYNFYEFKNLFK